MISLERKADILLKYFRENMSQRKIELETGVSRKTIGKYVREFDKKLKELSITDDSKKIQVLIEEMTNEPKYDSSSRKKQN